MRRGDGDRIERVKASGEREYRVQRKQDLSRPVSRLALEVVMHDPKGRTERDSSSLRGVGTHPNAEGEPKGLWPGSFQQVGQGTSLFLRSKRAPR